MPSHKIPLIWSSPKEKDQVYFKFDIISKRLVRVQDTFQLDYDWMLIDNTSKVWISDSNFSKLRSTGSTIPVDENHWQSNTIQKCLWTGKYWLFANANTKLILRSDNNFSNWQNVSGISVVEFKFDMTTNGSNKVVVQNQNSTGYLSTNNGLSWNSKPNATFFLNFPKVYYDDTQWIVTTEKAILRSTNNGESFTQVATVTIDGINNQILCLCRRPDGLFYATGRNKYWTSSNGIQWTELNIGSGVTQNIIGEILYDGTKYVGIGLYDGPVWSNDGINWTKWTSTDGSVLNAYDYDYHRLHYNGNVYTFRNEIDQKIYKSLDGKSWSKLTHPIPGRWFVDTFPKKQDSNLNIK